MRRTFEPGACGPKEDIARRLVGGAVRPATRVWHQSVGARPSCRRSRRYRRSDQAARELGGSIRHGVLTYALVHVGLLADPRRSGVEVGADGRLVLKDWLAYLTKRVPRLFDEVRDGPLNDFGVPVTRSAVNLADLGASRKDGDAVRVPQLFDFVEGERLGSLFTCTELAIPRVIPMPSRPISGSGRPADRAPDWRDRDPRPPAKGVAGGAVQVAVQR